MNKLQVRILGVVCAMLLLQSCSLVPLTGRRQLSLVSDADMISTSFAQYNQFLSEHALSRDAGQKNMVNRVGNNIKNAVVTYFAQNGMSNELAGFQWEFNLIEDKQANAWCMPGGKVVVYSGILPITLDETGLAVVLRHEIAHAVAKHSNERMSQALLTQLGGQTLAAALQQENQQTQNVWMSLFGAGAQIGAILPNSRLQESEADHLGLVFMAMAGYDPHGAISFWQRMSQGGGQSPPEFLSTHPSDSNRIREIESDIPEAMKYYKR